MVDRQRLDEKLTRQGRLDYDWLKSMGYTMARNAMAGVWEVIEGNDKDNGLVFAQPTLQEAVTHAAEELEWHASTERPADRFDAFVKRLENVPDNTWWCIIVVLVVLAVSGVLVKRSAAAHEAAARRTAVYMEMHNCRRTGFVGTQGRVQSTNACDNGLWLYDELEKLAKKESE
jgi:hypothetical protein